MKTETVEATPAVEIVIPDNIASIRLYSSADKALAELRARFEKLVVNCSTTAGMETAKASRRDLVSFRTGVEAARKEKKAPALEYGKQVDSQAKALIEAAAELEAPIDAAIKAEEGRKEAEKEARLAAERQRIESLQLKVREIQAVPANAAFSSSAVIAAKIETLAAQIIDDSYGEFQPMAEAARNEALVTLGEMLGKKQAEEAEAARLARERAELEEQRAQQEAAAKALREEEEKRIAAERAELAKLRAEQEERAKAERAEADKKLAAERAENERVAQVERDRLAAERAELQKQQAEADRVRREQEAAEAAKRAEAEALAKAERDAIEATRRNEERRARMEVLAAILEVTEDATIKDKAARTQIGILTRRALKIEAPADEAAA